MADISDVERALVSIVAAPLFPATTYLPGDMQPSSTGFNVRAYRGWPIQAALANDIAAGITHVSVFPDPGMTRNVSRWIPEQAQVSTIAPTITATVSGATVTLAGTITAGNVVGIAAGSPLAAYAYIIQAGDTLSTAAAALATKAGATSSGAVITMPSALRLTAATMTPQTVLTITRQQQQGFRISVWAPTPAARDAVAGLVDNAIAGLLGPNGFPTRRFAIGTYETGRIEYRATYVNDTPSREGIFRRDICYTVEYCTSLIEQDPIMLFGGGTLSAGNPPAAIGHFGPTPPT